MKMNRFLALSVGVFASCLASVAWAGVKIDHWTTTTGARVYFIANPDLPILDVQVDIPAGAARDPQGKIGLASLTRGMLDGGISAGGSEPAMNEEQIADRVVDLGLQFGGGVDGDRSSITLRTLSDPIQRDGSLDLLCRLLSSPVFPADILAREKSRTIAALQDANTRPGPVLVKQFSAAIYGDHPYGYTASAVSVGAISRDDLLTFYRNNYTSNGAVISLIGAISRAEAEQFAERIAAALPSSAALPALPPVQPSHAQTLRIPLPATQAHIAIGMPAVSRTDPDYYALLLGNYTLGGGGFVSHLMQEVREKKGYAYDVHSYFLPAKLEGPFQIGLQTRRERAEDALDLTRKVLDTYLQTGPTEAELAAAKRFYIDSLPLRTDNNAKLLGYLSAIGFYGLPLDYLDQFPRIINAVTTAQVRAALANHVKADQLVTVVVGETDK
ncbi:MAG TPA: pitrilysin family protein [Rhodocyclaceae bacterium]|nr:pitrilysin family protein [Rhodocyclaceae bacterium]